MEVWNWHRSTNVGALLNVIHSEDGPMSEELAAQASAWMPEVWAGLDRATRRRVAEAFARTVRPGDELLIEQCLHLGLDSFHEAFFGEMSMLRSWNRCVVRSFAHFETPIGWAAIRSMVRWPRNEAVEALEGLISSGNQWARDQAVTCAFDLADPRLVLTLAKVAYGAENQTAQNAEMALKETLSVFDARGLNYSVGNAMHLELVQLAERTNALLLSRLAAYLTA